MSDHGAYRPLLRALEAVSVGDGAALTVALAEAEAALPRRRHDSRDAIAAARQHHGVGAGDAAWGQVYQAIVALTSAFPPDPSTCPPPPSMRGDLTCPACSTSAPAGAAFCPKCGTAVTATH